MWLDEGIVAKLQKEVNEFGEMNVLREMEHKFVQSVFMRAKIVELVRNNFLGKEGERANCLYFIKDGEVNL